MCKSASRMDDPLISTAAVAELAGRTVATVNRWAAEKKLTPAHEMPGKTGARLYRRSDVIAYLASLERSEASA